MLKLDKHIKLDKEAILAANLCNRFNPADLEKIGAHVWTGYDEDRKSRWKWERRNAAAMDLAMQVQRTKSFPWANCSNVAFPLVTIGALQFHSTAYPALIQGTEIVKMRVIGEDPNSEKTKRANRIATHMSWQVLEEDTSWEEGQDRLLINLPIVGTVFKKSYHDAEKGYNTSEVVLAQDLVLDYWAKSVETCPRKTHRIPLFRNYIFSQIGREVFRDVREEGWYKNTPVTNVETDKSKTDNRAGITPPAVDYNMPFSGLEQHVELDLDGDGYAEPYIITIEENSKAVLRITCGFDREEDIERTRDGEVIAIRRMEYFTKYSFIPSPDGGVMDIGFGMLLGPLNESVNSLINMLIDAGTWSVTAGGFIGKGAKIRGGNYTFSPLEWKRVESSGDDLRKNIVPAEVREPSNVLFQLLGLLIEYTNRIAGTQDTQMGENPGQNTPAETMRTMVEQGRKIYNAVHKRVWRSMKEEFKKRYILNGLYMPVRKAYGKDQMALREDYLGNPDHVVPAADPNITSDTMQLMQATALKQAAGATPGYNPEEVERRYLKALKIDGIEQVYPGVSKTGSPESEKIQIAKLKQEGEMAWLEFEKMQFMYQLQEEYRVNSANIAKLAAEIENMKEVNAGDAQDRQVAIMQSVMKMMDTRNQEVLGRLDVVKKQLEIRREQVKTANAGNMGGLDGASGNRSGKKSNGSAQAGA